MRPLLEYPEFINPLLKTGMRHMPFVGPITDNYQLTELSPSLLIIDPNGGDKDLRLPLATDETVKGMMFWIFNNADADGEAIVVKNTGETETVLTIARGDMGLVWNTGEGAVTSWAGTILQASLDNGSAAVAVGGTALTLTKAQHRDKTILLDHTAAASTVTLPAATGSGARIRFRVTAVNTNNHLIKVPDASHTLKGVIVSLDNDANAATAYAGTGTDDTITLNGTTTGGQIGDIIEVEDIATNVWGVSGMVLVPAGSNVADMFSATV